MPNPVLRPPPKATLKPNSKQQLLSCTCQVRKAAAEACCRAGAAETCAVARGLLTLRCGGRRSTSQRSRHNGPPRARKGCDPRRTGASWCLRGAGVGGRLTNLVHLAKLLLQVLLGHASETRVDHLNNLPERSLREKLRCGGGRRALHERRGVLCTRGAAHKLLALQQSVRDELLRPDRHRTLRHGGKVPAARRVMW